VRFILTGCFIRLLLALVSRTVFREGLVSKMTRLTKDNFKTEFAMQGFNKLVPQLQELCEAMWFFCAENVQPFVITETVTTTEIDEALGRVSQSHVSGRAIDVRVKDWPSDFIEKFKTHFTEKYNHLGAVSKSDGVRRLIVHHNSGHGDHFHIQIGRDRI